MALSRVTAFCGCRGGLQYYPVVRLWLHDVMLWPVVRLWLHDVMLWRVADCTDMIISLFKIFCKAFCASARRFVHLFAGSGDYCMLVCTKNNVHCDKICFKVLCNKICFKVFAIKFASKCIAIKFAGKCVTIIVR